MAKRITITKKPLKTLFTIIGTLSLALGILGIFLPILPTTPFLLLTAFLYAKSSDRLYSWLMNHKYLGPYIRDFRENKTIPLRAKILSLTMLWATICYSIYLVKPLILKIMLAAIAIGVTIHILHFKTKK